MGKQLFQKLNNKGASLIAVLVAISVVSIMGIIITQLTVTNLQMKEVERQGKTNFYDAEHVMDDLTAGLNAIAADAMEKAYNDMLGQYRAVTADGSTGKEVFSRMYLDNMAEAFKTTDPSKTPTVKPGADGKDVYKRGYYSISKVKAALKKSSVFGSDYTDDERNEFVTIPFTDDNGGFFDADYTTGEFILEGVQVSVKDEFGNMVTIKTDMVFHTPDINLDGSNLVKEFMRYSLIADRYIENRSTGVVIDGNVYAGSGGINLEKNSSAQFKGKRIITRGDITAKSLSDTTFGNEGNLARTQIWANNIKTKKTEEAAYGNRAKLKLYGYTFVSDDLELNGAYDEVSLKGEYYGYNFQENYSAPDVALKDAEFSSAIVINGKSANLNLTGLTRLMVAGRTFIGRNAGAGDNDSDIAMGESLAVRTNQIAYYVPASCIDFTNKKIDNVMFENYSGVANVSSYLKSTEPYTEFNYKYLSAAPEKVYYLNFASDQKANDFYTAYYLAKGSVLTYYAENYIEANALKLSNDVVLLLQGDLLYRNGSTGKLNEYHTNISYDAWGFGGLYYKFATNHALMYKALQLKLEDKISDQKPAEARLIETDENKMFKNLINETELSSLVNGANKTGDKEYIVIDGTKVLAIVDKDFQVDATINGNSIDGGIIISTGNVYVNTSNFAGTIISKGVISFASNASVDSDEILVSQMISEDIKKTFPTFATIFNGYQASANAAMGTATINKYLTYENWTKTFEN